MSWKDWSYARKGGIIAGGLFLLPIFYFWLRLIIKCGMLVEPFELINVGGANCSNLFHWGVINALIEFCLFLIGLSILTSVVFLFGALIGWIIGKISGN